MDNLEQQARKTIDIANSAPTWYDVSLGLWGIIIASGYGIGKFIKWFTTRELKRFWEEVDTKLDAKIQESEKRIEDKLLTRDKRLDDIAINVEKISAHYHDKTAMETGVLNQLLAAAEKLDKKVEGALHLENKDSKHV